MHCIDCGIFIPLGQVGHFAGGFREAPLCRRCSDRERGIVPPQQTIPFDLVAGMTVAHLSDSLIDDLLDYERCGGIWGELLARADQWHFWEVRRYGGTHVLSYFEPTGKSERPRSYWNGKGIQTGSLNGVLTYHPIPRNTWRWYPQKNVDEDAK